MRSLLIVAIPALLLGDHDVRRPDRMAVLDRGAWHTWWHADAQRTQWTAADPVLTHAVSWHSVGTGMETAELRLAASAPASRVRLVLMRIDTRAYDWSLEERRNVSGGGAWEVEGADAAATLALNAGQFHRGQTWGWVVEHGVEKQAPGSGPLSMAMLIDTTGAIRFVPSTEIETARARHDAAVALQSYPMLLQGDGVVPDALRADDRGVDLQHRDSRLAAGILRDGRLLLVLTRFDVGDGILRPVPIGPTTPEMAAIMGALGCSRAMMLDGGISSQLMYRDSHGRSHTWGAYRWVPMGLTAHPRNTITITPDINR